VSEPLLTARVVAQQLGVSTGALLRWTRAGKVPAVKLPSGAVRYRPEQIEEWLAGPAAYPSARARSVRVGSTSRSAVPVARPSVAPREDGAELSFPVLPTSPPPAATATEEEHDAC
jgi:excisionase family DNA binding protein